jgi:hypothetical protein
LEYREPIHHTPGICSYFKVGEIYTLRVTTRPSSRSALRGKLCISL